MSDPAHAADHELTRRRLLAMGGGFAAAATFGSWLDPLSALGKIRWPNGVLDARDAVRVKEGQFMPLAQFRRWHEELEHVGPANQKGLRAAGSRTEERYVDELRARLERAGVQQLHFESVPMRRWTTEKWSLSLLGGSNAGLVRTASYIPYSGKTSAQGVSGPLVFVDSGSTPAPGSLAGKIAIFDVPPANIPAAALISFAYPGREYDPRGELDPSQPYKRPFNAIAGTIEMLEKLEAAGAAGAVGVHDYPFEGCKGTYFPYDGIIRGIPGVYVDRNVGATLKSRAQAGTSARLALPATIKQVRSRNLIGFIPGRSAELVALHCHTDGSNAIEDNGPGAIVAMSQYLARLPRRALPRTILVVLTTGHFAGGNGSRAFISRHKNDLVRRTNAALTIEHLGTREWVETSPGRMGLTGRFEPGAVFAPGSAALVDASFAAIKRSRGPAGLVLRPLDPNASGVANDPAWPGEGQYFFAVGDVPDGNYISGPTYLLNWGIPTLDKVDHRVIRRQAIAYTEEILRLGRTPRSNLRNYTL